LGPEPTNIYRTPQKLRSQPIWVYDITNYAKLNVSISWRELKLSANRAVKRHGSWGGIQNKFLYRAWKRDMIC